MLEERGRAEAAYYDTYKHWADSELKEVKSLGLIEGDGNNRFRPDDGITRAEYITMVVRALQQAGVVTVDENAQSALSLIHIFPSFHFHIIICL